MKNKKRMKEKDEFISSLMKGEAMGLVSEKKVKRVCKSNPSRNRSHNVLSLRDTNINLKIFE